MKRRTVSLTDAAADALDRLARRHDTNVSCVVEAAALALGDEASGSRSIEKRIARDRRGGRRSGAGRPKGNVV